MNSNKFNIYPAIHLRSGQVVRFTAGDTDHPMVFHSDPIACARQWIEQGAEWLQVINLDAAFDEDARHNWDLIERMAELDVKIQFGGGIRDIDDVHWAMKSGIERVIIGTGAVENPQMMAEALAQYGADAIILAIDADAAGEIKTHGWRDNGSIQAAALAIQMRQLGITTAVHTSIQRDGSMTGVDLETSIDLARMSGLRIVVGGGIGSMQDVRECFNQDGIDGVIIGKALYTGKVDLAQALRMVNRKDSFETSIARWKADQDMPWNRFGYELAEHNLKKHIPKDSPPLHILDAGGGNGVDSLGLARMNHQVDIVDIARPMLDDARANAALAGVTDRVRTHAMDIIGIERKFAAGEFDIILCHNVIQFVDEVEPLLESLVRVLKPGGFLSLITINQYALPLQAALVEGDLEQAYERLDRADHYNTVFGISDREYRPEDIIEVLEKIGFEIEKHYGIRCLHGCWSEDGMLGNADEYRKLRRLETELTERAPYKNTATQFQLIARKN